jgi:hypothetical protein
MVRQAAAFPALFTDDDIDVQEKMNPSSIPKSTGSILSIAAGNCRVANCSKLEWTPPRRRHPYTFGTAAIVITDVSAASEFVKWVESNHTRKWNHMDGKLYLKCLTLLSYCWDTPSI